MGTDRCETRIIHKDKVERAQERDLSESQQLRLASLFKACGDQNRLRILHALLHEEMCVCDLAALLTASESAVSHQLRQLRSIGLVKNRREGTILYYQITDPQISDLIEAGLRIHFPS